MPHRAPGSPHHDQASYLSGRQIRYYRPTGSPDVRRLIDDGFQAFLGAWVAFEIADDWPAYLAAVAVGGLGIDAIYSAIRDRRSLISRIAPLP